MMRENTPKIHLRQGASMAEFQQYVYDLESMHGWLEVDLIHNCFLMGEEMGELFKAIRKHQQYFEEHHLSQEASSRAHIGEEIVDILNYLLAIANRLNIDIESAFRQKNLINQGRNWSSNQEDSGST